MGKRSKKNKKENPFQKQFGEFHKILEDWNEKHDRKPRPFIDRDESPIRIRRVDGEPLQKRAHMSCQSCHGTGVNKITGAMCIHHLYCA